VLGHALLALLLLYLFMSSINLMGAGLKVVALEPGNKQLIQDIFGLTDQPIVGLCVGILVTGLVQSSSFTTSLTVGLVANGTLTFTQAVPIVMGANIGTTVTNTIVSMGHIGRRLEFRRAFAGSVLHDMFNVCTVLVFFPLNYMFKVLEWPAWHIGSGIAHLGGGAVAPTW
jgi:sodium-dependent phosphate cotransporter